MRLALAVAQRLRLFRELLERDYVFLKIDNVRDTNGVEVAGRIVSDREHFGVPFHTIFDSDQTCSGGNKP